MKDHNKTMKQLIEELNGLRGRLDFFEQTEQKHHEMEEELRNEKNRAQNYLDIAGVILVAINADGTVSMINKKGSAVLGYGEDEIIGKNWFDICIPRRVRDEIRTVFRRLMDGDMESVESLKNPVLTKAGEERLIAWHNTVLTDDTGVICGTLSSGEDITEIIRAEADFRLLQRDWEQIFHSIGHSVMILDPEHRIITMNRAGIAIFNISEEKLQEKRCHEIFHGTDTPPYGCPMKHMLATHSVETVEKEIDILGGTFLVSCTPVSDEAGNLDKVIHIAMDISEKKKSELALQTSEERYRSLVETTVSIIISLSTDFSILEFNPEAERVYGFRRDDVLGKNYLELFIPDAFRYAIAQDMQKVLDGEPTRGFESPVIVNDGTERVLAWQVSRILDDEENPIGIVCVGQDITERITAEKALQESELKYRSLFQDSRDVIFIITPDGRFVDVNNAGLALFGYTRDEVRELDVRNIYIDPNDRFRFLNQFNEKDFVRDYDVTMRKKNGTQMDCLLTVTVRRTGNGRIQEFRGILRDISERKGLEEQLFQAQKMEAIGILAGGVAHDFNNLLTTIHGYTDLTMMQIDEENPLYRNLIQIRQASVRAADLTRQLLLFSRKQPMMSTFINVNRTVEQLIKMLKRLIGEDINIEPHLEPGLWIVRGDRGNIEQVLMNMAVNARDAMPSGGKITIRTENVYVDEGYSKSHGYGKPGEFVCLSISDTGIGISKEIVEHIFEPFFTTKGAGQGSGLGLAVVYGIVKQHDGWINIDSELNQGTRFEIYLPAFPDGYETEEEVKASPGDVQGKRERILLVEDDAGVREFVKGALSKNGYVIFEAASAKKAMDLSAKEHDDFHLVFTDVVLPDMTGLQLIDQLLSRNSELRVLLSSGYTDDKSQWEIIREKGYRFLEKPYGITSLLKTIRETITST